MATKTVFAWIVESVSALAAQLPSGEPDGDLVAEGYEIIGVVNDPEVQALFWLVSRNTNESLELQIEEDLVSQALIRNHEDADALAKKNSIRLRVIEYLARSAGLKQMFQASVHSLVVLTLRERHYDMRIGKGWQIGCKLGTTGMGSAFLPWSLLGGILSRTSLPDVR